MVLNALSLSEHISQQTVIQKPSFHKRLEDVVDDDDSTETTCNECDSFCLLMNDSSLKTNLEEEEEGELEIDMLVTPEAGFFSGRAASFKKFQKVPMQWLGNDKDDNGSLRGATKERTMSDFSFKPQESLGSLEGWEDEDDLGDLLRTQKSRMMSSSGRMHNASSLVVEECLGRSYGWGSMAFLDISIQDPSACKRNQQNNNIGNLPKKNFSNTIKKVVEESTFCHNMNFLQKKIKKSTFAKNMKTISMMLMGK